jgi:hypothetical protein
MAWAQYETFGERLDPTVDGAEQVLLTCGPINLHLTASEAEYLAKRLAAVAQDSRQAAGRCIGAQRAAGKVRS